MSRRHFRALNSRLLVVVFHLLKWRYQPERRSTSWHATIMEQRQQVRRLVRHNPGLRAQIPSLLRERYLAARAEALRETGLPASIFPLTCPWSEEQILATDFWPEG